MRGPRLHRRGRAKRRSAQSSRSVPGRRRASQASPAGRGVWSLLDQAASSLSNYALFIAIARTAGVDGLGAFSVAYSAYAIILGTVRAVTSDPLIVRFSAAKPAKLADASEATTGFGLVCGIGLGAVLVAVGLALGGRLSPPLVALGLVLPGLLVQDACRFVFIAGKQPKRALVNDSFWLVTQVAAIVVLVSWGRPSVFAQVLAWGLAGGAAAVLGIVQLRQLPAPLRAWPWAVAHRDLGLPFGGAFLVDRGSSQLGFTLVGATGGLGTLGALTAARALFAPVTTVLSAASSFAVAEGTRLQGSKMTIRRYSWYVALALAAMPILLATILYLGPQQLGRILVGRSWPAARSVIVPIALFSATLAATLGLWTGLKVLQAARATLGTKLAIAPISVAAPLVGDLLWGVQGAAYGLVVSGLLALALWAWVFEARMRERTIASPSRRRPLLGFSQIGLRRDRSVGDEHREGNGKTPVPSTTKPGAQKSDIAQRAEAIFAALEAPGGAAAGAGPAALGRTDGLDPHRRDRTSEPAAAAAWTPAEAPDSVDVATKLRGIEDRLVGIEQALRLVLERLDNTTAPSNQVRPNIRWRR